MDEGVFSLLFFSVKSQRMTVPLSSSPSPPQLVYFSGSPLEVMPAVWNELKSLLLSVQFQPVLCFDLILHLPLNT